MLVAQSCPTLCNPMDCDPPGFSVCGDSPGKNTGVDCHSLLQSECVCVCVLHSVQFSLSVVSDISMLYINIICFIYTYKHYRYKRKHCLNI